MNEVVCTTSFVGEVNDEEGNEKYDIADIRWIMVSLQVTYLPSCFEIAYIFWKFQPGENGAEDKIGNAEGLFDPCTPPHMDTSIMFGGQTGILSEGRKDSAWGWLESGNTTYLAIGIGMF